MLGFFFFFLLLLFCFLFCFVLFCFRVFLQTMLYKRNQEMLQNRARISAYCVLETGCKGFACTTRSTHIRAWFFTAPCFLGFLLYSALWRKKTTKHAIILESLHSRILYFTQVRVLMFFSLSCNLVLWYELNEKILYILLYFPIPKCRER